MHEEIIKFNSRHYYSNKIKTEKSVIQERLTGYMLKPYLLLLLEDPTNEIETIVRMLRIIYNETISISVVVSDPTLLGNLKHKIR